MIKFYVGTSINSNVSRNSLYLEIDDWNDWWEYKTQYSLYYVDSKGEYTRLGGVKIATMGLRFDPKDNIAVSPSLPNTFNRLDNTFFSLGQSREYYENLAKLSNKTNVNLFECLQDMSHDLSIYEKVRDEHVMRRSLLRDVSSRTLIKQFNRIAHGGAVLTSYDFAYRYVKNIKDKEKKFNEMTFHVDPESIPASNIHVIIGRNGVGKTRLLHNMVESYFNKENEDNFVVTEDECNYDSSGNVSTCGAEKFPNLIYSSYSAFDDMEILNGLNYSYLGLREKIFNGEKEEFITKSVDKLTMEFVSSFRNCMTYEKAPRLAKALKMLEFDLIFADAKLTQLLDINELVVKKIDETNLVNGLKTRFEKFSTGHRVILITITKLVESLEEQSLVLLDEPETHLHPPLLAAFIRCLSELLFNRNAVAIIATHSSIILQEVTKDCVWKLRRIGSESKISRPKIQTFGTSHSDLNEEVFRVDIEKTGFHQLIKDQVKKSQSFDELNEKFGYQIGEEAEILARSMYYLGENPNES
ncbi:AAA family ATPase [Anaerorhabdus sp.]|uniref:AAA family ATPase n=1 Tax=Anaerorhabdus sp. TaxID=1872524 RepID=UPI002FC9EC2C